MYNITYIYFLANLQPKTLKHFVRACVGVSVYPNVYVY